MTDDEFEWDHAKAVANFIVHGVSFVQATGVFEDPFAFELLDDRADYGEDRFVVIGMSGGRTLAVVYTMREERIRIISAREAQPHERRKYHEAEV